MAELYGESTEDHLAVGVQIQCLQKVEFPPRQQGSLIQIFANKSLVLGPFERLQLQLPYVLKGRNIQMFDAVSSVNVKLHLKMRAGGQPWCIVQNLTSDVQTITPKQRVILIWGTLQICSDIDGLHI